MQEVMNKELPINFSYNSHRCRGLIILLQHMQEVIMTKLSINFLSKSHRYRDVFCDKHMQFNRICYHFA